MDQCYQEAKKIIEDHIDVLHASAKLLLEKERITGSRSSRHFSKPNANELVLVFKMSL